MSTTSQKSLVTSLSAIGVLMAVFLIVLWRVGFLTFTGSDPSSKVVGAAIALVGVFITAMVSAVGMVLKHSLDAQAERRLQMESDRNAALQREAAERLKLDAERNAVLQREAEDRLKLEACIRAVQLFAPNGQVAPPIQLTGALYTLLHLGQQRLTVELVFDLIERKAIEPGVAANLVDQVLRDCDDDLEGYIISNATDCAKFFITPSGFAVPESVLNKWSSFTGYSRRWIPVLLGEVMMGRPLADWHTRRYSAYAVIAGLCLAWQDETDANLKAGVGTILEKLLTAFPETGFLYHPRETIDTDRIREEIAAREACDDGPILETADLLDAWLKAPSSQAPRTVTMAPPPPGT